MATWEANLVYPLQAETAEDLLLALVVRSLLDGTSYDVELEGGETVTVEFTVGEELEGEFVHLLIDVEGEGREDSDMVQELTEQLLDDLFEEAEQVLEERTALGDVALDELTFEAVPEGEERPELVLPEWLAPDGAQVPFGFRSFRGAAKEPWPANADLDAHGRVVVVPHGGRYHAFGLPAPAEECGCGEEHAPGEDPHPER